jgi:CRISPR-associated protein Csx16
MTTIFATQHPETVDWLYHCDWPNDCSAPSRGTAEVLTHFHEADLVRIKPGDIVAGSLPIQIVVSINARGGRYFHIEMSVPEEVRKAQKRHFTREEMEEFGARLVEFKAERVGPVDGGMK